VIAGYAGTEKGGQHSDAVLTDFEEELKLLDEWLANHRIFEYYTEVTVLPHNSIWRGKEDQCAWARIF